MESIFYSVDVYVHFFSLIQNSFDICSFMLSIEIQCHFTFFVGLLQNYFVYSTSFASSEFWNQLVNFHQKMLLIL